MLREGSESCLRLMTIKWTPEDCFVAVHTTRCSGVSDSGHASLLSAV